MQFNNLFCSFTEIWRFDKRLFWVLIVNVIVKALQPFPSIIFSGLIIDTIAEGKKYLYCIFYTGMMFGLQFFLAALSIILGKAKEYLFLKFTNKLDIDINKKCLAMDYEQFNDSYFQDIILLISQMVQGDNYFTNISTVFDTLSQIITLIGIIVIMTMLNGWLLFISTVVIVLQSLLHIIRQKYTRQFQINTVSAQRKLGYISQIPKRIAAKKDIDMFSYGEYVLDKIKSFQRIMLDYNKKRINKDVVIEIFIYLFSVIFQISAYVLIGMNAFHGIITVGEFTMGITSLISFMSATTFVTTNVLNLSNSLFYINKYKMFLEFKSKFDENEGIHLSELNLSDFVLEFKNVSFRYPDSTSYVLKNINLKISNKEKLAIVGYNGAGKTSFTLLLTRMYEPTEGEILLNGINIKDINYREYLKIFSTVNQDFFLFPFSILENICPHKELSKQEYERIMNLCKEYGMEERIKRMYKGLDTPVSKELFASGIDLSGGERQKVAMLRALYKNSYALVLDEPTAALDPVAECEIYRKFSEISEGKLTVYISHRINSTRFCDRIAVFDEGKIKEYGTFDELMTLKGLYYHFFETQAELYK